MSLRLQPLPSSFSVSLRSPDISLRDRGAHSLEVESELGVVLLDENARSALHGLRPNAALLMDGADCRERESKHIPERSAELRGSTTFAVGESEETMSEPSDNLTTSSTRGKNR